jgi:sigma-B regulation protein RsbU (phosphoserine phosphatase)
LLEDDGPDGVEESAEELFEEAPCGYLTTLPDGTIVRVNRTFERWTGLDRHQLLGTTRFQDLLSAGGRIYHETHYAPMLRMHGAVREIAVEIVCADGSRLPVLINSQMHDDPHGQPGHVRTTIFDASDRRRYEQELLRAQRREQDIARQLQRGMLAGALPAAPGLTVDVGLRPADRSLELGGDWYDAFWLTPETTALTIVGDVVGHGVGAATMMGQLRSAVRALALTQPGPAAILSALDAYAVRHDVGEMTTLVLAQVDIHSRHVRYACAGHPPPLLVSPGESPRFLLDGRSMPIHVPGGDTTVRDEASCALPPGSRLLLYTDGLIERRAQLIDQGMERLATAAAARRDDPGSRLVSALLHELPDSDHPDDVCILLVSV